MEFSLIHQEGVSCDINGKVSPIDFTFKNADVFFGDKKDTIKIIVSDKVNPNQRIELTFTKK